MNMIIDCHSAHGNADCGGRGGGGGNFAKSFFLRIPNSFSLLTFTWNFWQRTGEGGKQFSTCTAMFYHLLRYFREKSVLSENNLSTNWLVGCSTSSTPSTASDASCIMYINI